MQGKEPVSANSYGLSDEDLPKLMMFESLAKANGSEFAERLVAQNFDDAVARRIRAAYEKKVGIIAGLAGPATLRSKGLTDWYAGPNLEEDRFWPPLRRYLLETKGWAPETVDTIDRESTSVMRLLRPVSGEIDVRGLVVGYVQSGKTANYTALIAKASDVGYRLIIVLAGVHNSLRRQTQQRLQAELIDVDPKLKSHWHTLTELNEDFRSRGTNTDAFLSDLSHQRILLVVKKNAHVLRRLVRWLGKGQQTLRERCPALIIDDEADQATVNTAKADSEKRSAINRLVVELKAALPRSAYVAYTATPFANVLINPQDTEDLYPRDFIVSLAKPPNYFGAELFFGREALLDEEEELKPPPDMFRRVDVHEVSSVRPGSRDTADFEPEMVESLQTALHYFFLATAARHVRGQTNRHSSMLVHTSLKTGAHDRLQKCIAEEVARLRKDLNRPATRTRLEELWNEEHPRVRKQHLEPVSFAELEPHLANVLRRTKVVIDNGMPDRLSTNRPEFQRDAWSRA